LHNALHFSHVKKIKRKVRYAMPESSLIQTIAVLGGTGKEGSALAMRWALNGYKVIVGSRDAEKAQQAVQEMNEALGGDYLVGMSNDEAVEKAVTVVLSVPYSAHHATLESLREALQGKVLIDITVPLAPPAITTVSVPVGKAAGLEAQALLGTGVRVVSAFQNVSAVKLKDPKNFVDCDVLVCLVEAADLRAIDAGPLANAVAVEALTPVLLYINKKYKVKGAGIRITGIE
jgi:8-hydroxy-5-deazaflavin:NADPH oxidoreductase